MASAADGRLARNIRTVAGYESFRRWVSGKGLDAEKVMKSTHAWASYGLGSDALFENEPEIQLAGLSVGSNGTREPGSVPTVRIRVTVTDGGKTASVDAAKVAALFAATEDPVDWSGGALLVSSVEPVEPDTDGSMTFDVTAGDESAWRAFFGIRGSYPSRWPQTPSPH